MGWLMTSSPHILGLGFPFCAQQAKLDSPEVPSSSRGGAGGYPTATAFCSSATRLGADFAIRWDWEEVQVEMLATSLVWKFAAPAVSLSACPSLPPTHKPGHCVLFLETSTEVHFPSPPPALTFCHSIHRISYLFGFRIFWLLGLSFCWFTPCLLGC